MREVNFSIPNANKASVGITTALYDRRALDCTSTLPLINSLNNLACLTTSSARIRDILTVDGGVERLVCILKEGRSKDMMEIWKWNLAFQCIVNIGVRGSEAVRTRVVEADIVPVIATILDNYVKVIEKCKEKAEEQLGRGHCRFSSSKQHASRHAADRSSSAQHSRADRVRRGHVPPPIEIPQSIYTPPQADNHVRGNSLPAVSFNTQADRNLFNRQHRHHHQRSHDRTNHIFSGLEGIARPPPGQQLGTNIPASDTAETFGLRPVREAERLPSMLPLPAEENSSQPVSPRTPNAVEGRSGHSREPSSSGRSRQRPPLHQQLSMSGESDGDQNEEAVSDEVNSADASNEPIVGIQNNDISMQDVVDDEEMMETGAPPVTITNTNPSDDIQSETFNITHRGAIDSSMLESTTPTPPQAAVTTLFSPAQPNINVINATPPAMQVNWYPARMGADRNITAGVLAAVPRDEDVLLSLQLLAYVSKYCNLRSYFQQSHLVPRLRIGDDLALLDGDATSTAASPKDQSEDDWDAEYLLENDFNIFPLVEKFTVRHHSGDMKYWAGVVMRNLCRKDDSRNGIRQCAWYKCGKWEKYQRQFAKCRRCRRTKYCSKDCQKSAWVFHRHWCTAASQEESSSGSGHHGSHSHRTGHHASSGPTAAV